LKKALISLSEYFLTWNETWRL